MTSSESMMIRAAMFDALALMCREDAVDADAYVYAFDRLAHGLGIAPVSDSVLIAKKPENMDDDVRKALDNLLTIRKADDNGIE